MYSLVFMYSSGIILHIPWRIVMGVYLSLILPFSAPVQPLTDSCKNYCKVLVIIFTGSILTLVLLRVKKRHQALGEYLLRNALKGGYSSVSWQRRFWLHSRQIWLLLLLPTTSPAESVYQTLLLQSSKGRNFFPLCDQKAKGTNTALLVYLEFFWKGTFSRTVFNSSQIYLRISRKHALCAGKK